MEYDIEVIQSKLLEMAKNFHQFCVENELTYFMIGGTQLGAVRHKGFIPWDDDMDFGMPREDYEKLLAIRDKQTKYEFKEYRHNPDFKYAFIKMYDPNTTMIEKCGDASELVGGLFIDIFPLDGAGNDLKKAEKKYRRVYLAKRVLNGNLAQRYEHNKLKNFLVKFVKNIKTSKIFDFGYNTYKKFTYKDSSVVGNLFGVKHQKELMAKEIFGNPVLYDFEDTQFYGVADYDAYLTRIYGDYMVLPPENKREKHAIEYLNFDLPYREYSKSQSSENQMGEKEN